MVSRETPLPESRRFHHEPNKESGDWLKCRNICATAHALLNNLSSQNYYWHSHSLLKLASIGVKQRDSRSKWKPPRIAMKPLVNVSAVPHDGLFCSHRRKKATKIKNLMLVI
ncbi:hypothetical protein NPIL_579111 [Nephila pilipes]|uniref:Uncharacterized protein n=1 Tax=Nephila pilipes TaxID=299642 RepID=A0A8X6TXQ8_NEPPI|nr:hypothetical protein NPIL_579111 [Nephila pilipes]